MTPLEITLTIICLYLFTFYKIKNRNDNKDLGQMPNEIAYVIAPLFLLIKIFQTIKNFIFDEWYPKV